MVKLLHHQPFAISVGRAALLWFAIALILVPQSAMAGIFDKVVEIVAAPVQAAVQVVQQGAEATVNLANQVAQGGANILNQAGAAIESTGGDGARLVGGTLKGAGNLVGEGSSAAAGIAVTGVLRPTAELSNSLVETATILADLDLSSPKAVEASLNKAATSASGLVLSVERTVEKAAMDIESLSLEALPEPLEKGVRHMAAEPLRELEKKNPRLARTLRFLPVTSNLYNHLKHLAKDEWVCQPETIYPALDTEPREELDSFARWSSVITTPVFKGTGTSGWTATNCRATAVGIAERDSVHSDDNLITIDLRLASLSVGGSTQDVVGRFLRVEVLPIGRAHQFANYRPIKKGEAVLVSGELFRDEDLEQLIPPKGAGFLELHPVNDLEVIATPPVFGAQSEHLGVAGHFIPGSQGESVRFATHVVRPGESLAVIAQHYYGVQSWPILARANPPLVRHADLIQPGWVLSIPVRTERGVAVLGQPSEAPVAGSM